MKELLSKLIAFVFILFTFCANSQNNNCSYSPAPCPNSSSISGADEWQVRIKNGAIEQGLAFQKKIRNQVTDLLQKTCRQNSWQVYQVTDEYFDGPPFQFISFANWEAAPYEKRPPVWDDLAFVIIVDKDSLMQWRKWQEDFLQQAEKGSDQYVTNIKKTEDDALLKSYFDSANYYSQQRIKYSDTHQQQYLQDLKNNNKAALQEHEKMEKFYLDKSDAFIKKYQNRQSEVYSNANQSANTIQNVQAKYSAMFAESSIVLIHFGINPYHVTMGMEDGGQHSIIPQYSLKISGASYAGLLINKKIPDVHAYDFNYKGYFFNSPASVATILFGNYQPKDSYNNYRPIFEKNFTSSATTLSSIKNIKCDVLQNLAVHIEGRPDKVNTIIKSIDWIEINSMTGK
jgi:hypothetical protein